jgi:hypothetical protein
MNGMERGERRRSVASRRISNWLNAAMSCRSTPALFLYRPDIVRLLRRMTVEFDITTSSNSSVYDVRS